jgi:hypothetical protein
VVDAAQIEARVVAWLANEEWILEAFREKRDLYSEFASTAYGRIITKADQEERFVGKTCVLGLGFGMGGPKLQTSVLTKSIEQGLDPIRLPLEVCSTLVGTYRRECENIVALWATLNNEGITSLITGDQFKHKCVTFGKEHVRLPNGLALLYPGVRGNIAKMRFGEERVFDASYQGSKSRSKLYGGLLTENIVQALARVIVADVMRIIAQKYRVVMMTHDEIVFLANKSEGQKALDWAIGLMSVSPSWAPDLPLSAEGGYGVEYVK